MALPLEIKSTFDIKRLSKSVREKVAEIVEEESLKAVSELQAKSPVATGQLQKSWDLDPAVNSPTKEVSIRIRNTAPAALNRFQGRRAGKFPPISALEKWVKVKLRVPPNRVRSVAFLIARKIAKEGTNRSKANFKEFDLNTGQPFKNGILDRAQQRIRKRLKEIKF